MYSPFYMWHDLLWREKVEGKDTHLTKPEIEHYLKFLFDFLQELQTIDSHARCMHWGLADDDVFAATCACDERRMRYKQFTCKVGIINIFVYNFADINTEIYSTFHYFVTSPFE